MIIEQIITGASAEAATRDALALLAAPDDAEVHIEVLQYEKKKLFGLKTEPAKVRVWYEKEDPKPAPAAKREDRPAPAKRETPVKKDAPAKKDAPKKENAAKKEAPVKKEAKKEAPKAEEAPAPVNEVKKISLPVDENDAAVKFLRLVVKGLDIENCNITLEKCEGSEEYTYTLDCGEEDGALIGRRGETLDAIQYLLRLTENKGVDEDKHRKLTVNVGNYREKRSAALKALAEKNARKVLKYGRNVALEPMSAYERRIIHTAIQGIEGVTSHSVGSDSNRKVIISLEEGVTPTNPSRGGYNRDRGGRRDDRRGGRSGYNKREAYKPAVTREPRKDNAGSLYGKIELPSKNEN